MRATSLLGVFVVAKAAVLTAYPVPLSVWAPIAYLWQDLVVVSLFAALDFGMRRPWVGWSVYAAISLYVAMNVPVARVLCTPLTWPLIRAVHGALADSIILYVTWVNVLLVLVVLGSAMLFPLLFQRVSPRTLGLVGALMIPPLLVMGPGAAAQVETLGLYRNVLAALLPTVLPRFVTIDLAADERKSPFPGRAAEDLSALRGEAAGRNVMLVVLESTAAQYLRCYGAAEDPMPHLTTLANQSLQFQNAYTTYPESIKGLFAVLCSTYPAINTTPERYEYVRPPSIADILGRAGYRTGLFHSGRFGYLGMDAVVRNRGFQTLEDAGDIGGDHQSSFGVENERTTVRRILDWIDAGPREGRFFAAYLPIAGHHPYSTPELGPFPIHDAVDRYRNALHHADAALGELLRGLRERELDRKTLIVIYGDHGEAFGQHSGNFAHTLFIYDENVRVPFVIAAPGLLSSPMRITRVASVIDTAPTVLDLLGLPFPAAYQGRSLLDHQPHMALFFTDYSLTLVGLRDERWKFIQEVETGRTKLFDLGNDSEEAHDLSGRYPERAIAYRQHLYRWMALQRDHVIRNP